MTATATNHAIRGDAITRRGQSTSAVADPSAAVAPAVLPSRRMVLGLAALAATLAIVWLPVHLSLPLGRDQAMTGLVATRVLEGYWPYAESWDHRGPVAYALYAALTWICDDVALAVPIGDLIFLALAAAAMRVIGRSLAQPWIAPIGTMVLVLVIRDPEGYGQPDLWLASVWLWVLAAFMHPAWAERRMAFALTGAAAGLGVLVKPVFVLLLVLPLLLAMRAREPARAAAALLGFLATCGAGIAVFAFADRLDQLIEVYVAFNVHVHAGTAGDSVAMALARFLVTAVAPWFDVGAAAITVTALLGLRVMWRRDRERARLLVLTWGIGLGCVLLQGKSHPHHFAFANIAVAVFAAYAVSSALHWLAAEAAADRQEFSLRLVLVGGLAIAGIALALQVHAARAANWWSAQLGLIPIQAVEAMDCLRQHCPAQTRQAAELIRRATDRSTPIFVFGTDASLYLAAERAPALRFLSTHALVSGPPGWNAHMRSEAIASLRAASPHIIVVEDFDDLRTRRRLTSRQHLDTWPELRVLLADRYEVMHDLGRFVIYRLKNAVMAGPLAAHQDRV